MAQENLNFTGLYNSNIEPEDRKIDSFSQYVMDSALKSNSQPNFGKIETMSFYNPLYQNQYKPRYEASWQYDNLGFDPHRDNETLYNEKMSGIDKFQRAAKQMGKVMAYSALDQLTWGGTSLMTADKFAEANAIGGSSEKGFYASTLNLMINAGFTLGIGAEVLLENIILGGLTMGAGNLALAAKTGKSVETIRRGLSMAEAARRQKTVAESIEAMAKSSKLSEFAAKAASFMNPLENTASFVNDMKVAERLGKGMNNVEKVTKGTTALFRDVQAARGVYTESLLEGNFAQKDMQDKWIMDYQAMYGHAPSEEEAKKFHENAKAANFATAMINMPLIYFTNKVTLAPIFRPLEKTAAGQVFGQGARRAYFDVSKSGLRTVKELPKETMKRIGFLAKNSPKTLAKNTLLYSGENFMEGAQEVLQEITSGAAKEYYLDNYDGVLRGSWYNYMLSNAAAQVSKQGLETFASGMLMQAFLSPIHHMAGGIMRGASGDTTTVTGKIIDKLDNFGHRNDKEYLDKKQKMRDAEEKKFKEDINNINYFFQNASNYFNGNYEQMLKSKRFEDLYKGKTYDELTNEEKSKYADAVHQRMNEYVVNAINRGYYSAVVDQMKDMSKTLKNSRSEVISDIGEEQAEILEKNVDAFIEKAENIKDMHDKISNVFQKPFSENDMLSAINQSKNKETTLLTMQFANEAYDKAVNDLIFAQDSVKLGLQRQQQINTEAMSVYNEARSKVPWDSISLLYDTTTIKERIASITGILNGINGGPGLLSTKASERTKEMQQQISDLEVEQLVLSEILKAQEVLSSPESTTAGATTHKQAKKNLKKSLRSYFAIMDQVHNPEQKTRLYATYDKFTDLVMDYTEVARVNNINNQTIEFLTDPDIWQKNIDIIAKAAESVYEQHQAEIENAIEKAKENEDNDTLVNELYQLGVVCKNLEQVRREKKMPQYLLDRDTKQKIDYLKPKYQSTMEVMRRFIPGLADLPIPERNTLESKGTPVGDSKTEEEFKTFGIEVGKTYSLKDILQKFIREGALPGEEKGYKGRRELANAFLSLDRINGIKVEIVDNANKSVSFTKDKITLDIRYFSKDYKGHGDYSFALMKVVTGALTIEALEDTNSDFYKKMSALFEEAKQLFKEKGAKEEKDFSFELIGFNSLTDFVIESLTNEKFQLVLSKLEKKGASDSYNRNCFANFVNNVKQLFMNMFKLFKVHMPETVFDESLSIITDYISEGKKEVKKDDTEEKEEIKFAIDKKSSGTTLVTNLTSEEKTIIANTYLLLGNEERNGRSDNEIITSKEFLDWFSDEENFTTKVFVDSHNIKYKKDESIDPLEISLVASDVTEEEEKEYERTGVPSEMRLKAIAVTLMEGHYDILNNEKDISAAEGILSPMEIKIWKSSHEIREKIRDVVRKIDDYTDKDNLTDDKVNEYMEQLKALGYDSKKLYLMSKKKAGRIRIANLAALGIPADDLVAFVQKEQIANVVSTAVGFIESKLQTVRNMAELDEWRTKSLDIIQKIPFSSVPSRISLFEIERIYEEKKKKLEEEDTVLVPEVEEYISYKGTPCICVGVDFDSGTCTLVDPNGEYIEIKYEDEQDNIEFYENQEEAKKDFEEYAENHQQSINETELTPEERNEVADGVEDEETEEETPEPEPQEEKQTESSEEETQPLEEEENKETEPQQEIPTEETTQPTEEEKNNISEEQQFDEKTLNLAQKIIDNFINCK